MGNVSHVSWTSRLLRLDKTRTFGPNFPGLLVSEDELQTEFTDPRYMNSTGVQKIGRNLLIVGVAIHTVLRARASRTGVRHIAATGIVHTIPLRMVEDIESLGAKLDRFGLFEFEALEQSHIEIETARSSQRITARVAKSEACGLRVSSGIVKQGPIDSIRHRVEHRFGTVRISHKIGIRAGTHAIAYPGVVVEAAVHDGDRFSRLSRGNTRYLPISEQ